VSIYMQNCESFSSEEVFVLLLNPSDILYLTLNSCSMYQKSFCYEYFIIA